MGAVLKNSSLVTMLTYLFLLVPQLVYKTLPISVLVAVLVTLGVLSKQNEVTAFKACGVGLHRLDLQTATGDAQIPRWYLLGLDVHLQLETLFEQCANHRPHHRCGVCRVRRDRHERRSRAR